MAFSVSYSDSSDTLRILTQASSVQVNEYASTPSDFGDTYEGQLQFYFNSATHKPSSVTVQRYRSEWEDRAGLLATILAQFYASGFTNTTLSRVQSPTSLRQTLLKLLLQR